MAAARVVPPAERGQAKTDFVDAPYPARAEPHCARAGSSGLSIPLASFSHVWRWQGWDQYRIPGCSGGRPRLGGTPVRDETVPAGCPRTGGGPFPPPDLPHIAPRSAKPGHSGHIEVLPNPRGAATADPRLAPRRTGRRTPSRRTRPFDGVRDRRKGASPQKGCVATMPAWSRWHRALFGKDRTALDAISAAARSHGRAEPRRAAHHRCRHHRDVLIGSITDRRSGRAARHRDRRRHGVLLITAPASAPAGTRGTTIRCCLGAAGCECVPVERARDATGDV
jgi:hypothetical protein